MSERDNYPAGVPCWVELLAPDPDAAAAFYGRLFGWEFAGPGPMPDGEGRYLVARLGGRDVAGVGSRPPGASSGWSTHVAVESADRAAAAAESTGGTVVAGPFDVAPAGRMAVLADPAGAEFCVWEAGWREGAQRVNEAGAWSMSMLTTADEDGANAFYGALFGWETESFALGDAAVTLWRLPGFVGGEPQQPVARDVVAVMAPAPPGAPAAWGVDFWVRDVDEAAQAAAAAGGTVLAAPYDIPGLRQAVLADPDGARFSVTRPVVA